MGVSLCSFTHTAEGGRFFFVKLGYEWRYNAHIILYKGVAQRYVSFLRIERFVQKNGNISFCGLYLPFVMVMLSSFL